MVGLDNNQKGFPLQHQRGGKNIRFQKVTAIMFKKFNPPPPFCPDPSHRVQITYINQEVPSPYHMFAYESLQVINSLISSTIQLNKDMSESQVTVDYSGSRVKSYVDIVKLCHEITQGVYCFLTGWNQQTHTYKTWEHQPESFITQQRFYLIAKFNSEKKMFIKKCKLFQRWNVLKWNPLGNICSEVIIAPVSL